MTGGRASIHVFTGPTISPAAVRTVLPDARVHPPVAWGDLPRIGWRPGDVAAIIDGLFLQAPSVRHKEILTLLERGVLVCGASSMGALRAAEMRDLGMVGVGLVYRLYALGVIDRDDEVAVAHTPVTDGCMPLSVALVSVRVAARRARVAGVIDAAHERHLVSTASAVPFGARRWRTVAAAARDAGGDPGQCAAFLDYCLAEQPDVKREDAWRLLTGLAGGRLVAGAARPRPALPLTHYQQVWELAARGATVHGVHVPDLDALRCLQLLSGDFPAFYRRLCLQLIAADAAGAAFEELSGAGTGEIAERALEAARARGLAGAIPLRALLHFDLAARAEGAELARADLLTLLVRSYRHEPGSVPREHAITLLGEVPAFAAARALVARCRHHLAELGRHDERLREERVTPAAVADLLRRRWPAGYQRGAAQDRGFASMPAVVKAARPLVPYLVAGADVPELGLLADLPPEWRSAPHLPALHR